ncbi:MAG: hypothetical protein AVDCRST_MAG18-2507 [uncultured Thermomicrobiales bacterium]|uniref:Uncharacterized protein n=1 Tax=uncultured Thermomicrobiales bacterium TaxID=1645740 RepID=A0A6J4VGG7_9BACT|nr:MAG: hypothetical protein AVDCRST_MAG18-2507 [uncultured Thermomicrobiales bacterium]
MLRGLLDSIHDVWRYRFGRPGTERTDATVNDSALADERDALQRHNEAEARMVSHTMADPNGIRAFGKGEPR